MFVCIIILLQFYEVFAWRDGLYFKSVPRTNTLAEKLLYIFCLSQIEAPSVALPHWSCCVRLVVSNTEKGQDFFPSPFRNKWTYKIKSLSILFLSAFICTKSSLTLSQKLKQPLMSSSLLFPLLHSWSWWVFFPKNMQMAEIMVLMHRERLGFPGTSEV